MPLATMNARATTTAGLLLLSLCFAAAAAEAPPGVVIDFSPTADKQYIGSPSIAVLPDGTYVASHDFFSPGNMGDRTHVFRSTDRGETWTKSAELTGQWWSGLFVHRGKLYLMGTSKAYGACVIRRSDDGGSTWTEPTRRFPPPVGRCSPCPTRAAWSSSVVGSSAVDSSSFPRAARRGRCATRACP